MKLQKTMVFFSNALVVSFCVIHSFHFFFLLGLRMEGKLCNRYLEIISLICITSKTQKHNSSWSNVFIFIFFLQN